MEYRSIADLNQSLGRMAAVLPAELELIVGVPRSGLLAANLLALHLNLPMTDLDGLRDGRLLATGSRFRGAPDELRHGPREVLVLDDCVTTGARMAEVRVAIEASGAPHRIRFAAAFASPEAVEAEVVDFFGEVVPLPRIFEWNVLHSPLLREFCLDIDGVLCYDPADAENDDGVQYRRFLEKARPLCLPTHEVGWLVTSRLEKYRAETEAWLAAQRVRYRHLIMMSYATAVERRAARAYARYKAEVYDRSGARLFIESSPRTALRVAELTGKPVFCMDTREMLHPGSTPRRRNVAPPDPALLRRMARRAARIGSRLAAAFAPNRALTGW